MVKIIKHKVEAVDFGGTGDEILKKIEGAGRICYKSEFAITPESAVAFVNMIMKRGHNSVLEHHSVSLRYTIDLGISHELVRHRLASYCLSGDTTVKSYNKNKRHHGKQWAVKQLYDWQFDKKRKGRIKLINLRSVNENMIIVPNKIKQITQSGIKNLYLVKTKTGREIKTTLNHRYYTPNGYIKLKDLKIGDRVYGNGILALQNKEYIEKRYLEDNLTRKELAAEIGCCEATLYKAFKKFNIFKPWSNRPNRKPGYGKKGMFTEKQRKEMSIRMSGKNNPSWKNNNIKPNSGRLRAWRLFTPDKCWGCGTTDKLERHHFDNNPINNNPNNIYFVCSKCHKAFHYTDIKAVFSDEIIEIKYIGKEMTYDIEMTNEPHNFVANGLVVHNSQESTRYCNYNKKGMEFILPVEFYPYVDWIKGIGTDVKPPKKFFYWLKAIEEAEKLYNAMIKDGAAPQLARAVLPKCLKTEIVVTMNLRELLHFFSLRCDTPAHPQMRDIAKQALILVNSHIPVVFYDQIDKFIKTDEKYKDLKL